MAVEVDFDIFSEKFMKVFKKEHQSRKRNNKLSDAMIWTEIFSVIKGGFKSHNFYTGFLPHDLYIKSECSPCLTKAEAA
jgi:hypothetical protein